jgi:hypothetical protein
MFFYKLGYWTYDGAAAIELMHDKWFGRAEYRALVFEGVAAVLREKPPKDAHFPFAWIYDEVASYLERQHGFRRIEYAAEFEIYGSGSMLEADPDLPDLNALTRYLQEQGLA